MAELFPIEQVTLTIIRCGCRKSRPYVLLKPGLDERYLVGVCPNCSKVHAVKKGEKPNE